MTTCAICLKDHEDDSMALWYTNKHDISVMVCEKCADALDKIIDDRDDDDSAFDYLSNCRDHHYDEETKDKINDVLAHNFENTESDNYDYDNDEDDDDDNDNDDEGTFSEESTGWISSLKIIYKLCFWIIIIVGVILGVYLGNNVSTAIGIIITVLSVLVALLIVGFQIVFLDLARDIHKMRNVLENLENKKR